MPRAFLVIGAASVVGLSSLLAWRGFRSEPALDLAPGSPASYPAGQPSDPARPAYQSSSSLPFHNPNAPFPPSLDSRPVTLPERALSTSTARTITPANTVEELMSPRPVHTTMELQLALVRRGISPGSIDGVMGPQTQSALRAFQFRQGLPVTGRLDPVTRDRLLLTAPPLTTYTISSDDLARLRVLSPTWLGKSHQDRLDYESALELVAEKGMAYPNYIRHLNPKIDWNAVSAGATVVLPDVAYPESAERAAFVKIFLADRVLQAFDLRTNLLAHFPCSIAQSVHKRPLGRLEVAHIVENPNYTFNPAIFTESTEARQLGRKLVVPPGPNNPVGVAWIGLDRPGYGIHGTPLPEKVGRTESHGCFRLSNWNAEFLRHLVWVSMPVYVEP
jgi:lipoprotein-anchoring transpeptidase ErfK/SrfK